MHLCFLLIAEKVSREKFQLLKVDLRKSKNPKDKLNGTFVCNSAKHSKELVLSHDVSDNS